MLKKEVRKILIETKEIKEKQLVENQIVGNRLLMVFEGIENKEQFNKLSNHKKTKMLSNFISEISYLEENKLLSENFLDSLKSLFGNSFEDIAQTLMEPMVNSILGSLGFKKGVFRNMFVSFLTSRPSDLIRGFGDCELMTKLVVRSFIEAEVMFLQQEAGLDGMALNFVRNKLGSMAEDTEFVRNLENSFSSSICAILGKAKSNADNVVKKIQDNPNGITSSLIPGL